MANWSSLNKFIQDLQPTVSPDWVGSVVSWLSLNLVESPGSSQCSELFIYEEFSRGSGLSGN